ncbi:MAG: caspase family protein [Candidatus Thiodiazotropha sp.]
MPSIPLPQTDSEHGTHALVIGVSRYPYADGDEATDFGEQSGLENLSSAARSASEFAAWLLKEYHNPEAELKSLHVLLSPADGEVIHPEIEALLPAPYAATRAAVRGELISFREMCRKQEDVGIVYVAGHGVQLSKRGAIVLLEDFAAEGQMDRLEGAIDMVGCHAGMNGNEYAAHQYWFVDACRQRPAYARKFESMTGALTFGDEPNGQVHSAPLFLASSTRESAFAERGGTSLFSRAVLAALRGDGARGPDEGPGDEWTVPVSRLVELLNDSVQALAGEHGEEQRVDITGRVNEAVIHRFREQPDVHLQLSMEPGPAAASTTIELLLDGNSPVDPPPSEWPIDQRVPAGLYQLKVQFHDHYNNVSTLLNIKPLEYRANVEVT